MPSKQRYPEPYFPEDLGFTPEAKSLHLDLSPDKVTWTAQTRYLKGERFSFQDRQYLLPIYRDEHNRLQIAKARQMEFSEFIVNWLYFNLWQHPNTVGLFISDRDSHTSKFSNMRIKEWTIKASPIIQLITPLRNHTSTMLKFTNGSILYFHSAWGDFVQARSVPADFAAIDERQDVSGESVDVLLESMSHSKYKKLLEVGTGADEGSDWHLSYMKSDAKEWDAQSMSWITTQPQNTAHASGYHVSQEMAPWITRAEFEQKRKDRTERYFITEVVGWWYHGLKKPITTKMLRDLFNYDLTLTLPSQVDHSLGPVFMGVDWGGGDSAFTVPWIEQRIVATGVSRLLWTEKITEKDVAKQADRVAYLFNAYRPTQAVMDGGGNMFAVQQLERAFGDMMPKCFYITTPKASSPKDYRFKLESMPLTHDRRNNMVSVNRTWLIDTNIQQITNKAFEIPAADEPAIEFILDHFTAIESILVKGAAGEYTVYDHDKQNPDDALHARNYRIVAELISAHKHKSKIGTGTLGGGR